MSKIPKKKPVAGAKMKPGQKQHVAGAGQAKIRDTARAGRANWGYLPYGRGGRPRPPAEDVVAEFYRAQGR